MIKFIYSKLVDAFLTFLICFFGAPLLAGTFELSASHYVDANGNITVEIQNVGDTPITIFSVVVNRKEDDPICHLIPVAQDLGYPPIFRRADIDEESLTGLGQKQLTAVTLKFGDEVNALIFRGCGSLLELAIKTDAGDYLLKTKR